MIRNILLVALGGGLGSVARYLVSRWAQGSILSAFPWGTMIVNIAGCVLIGFFCGLFDQGVLRSTSVKLFLTVGFCGGFTTFSTFMNENLLLLRSDSILLAAIYTGASVAIGLLGVYAGLKLAQLAF